MRVTPPPSSLPWFVCLPFALLHWLTRYCGEDDMVCNNKKNERRARKLGWYGEPSQHWVQQCLTLVSPAPTSLPLYLGTHQADGSQVGGRQGPAQATRHQGGSPHCTLVRWHQEAPSLPARHGGIARDSQVPEKHGAFDSQAALPAARARDFPGRDDRLAFPVVGHAGSTRGVRGLPRRLVRGHQPVCHPRQAGHHYAQGHAAGPPHPRRTHVRERSPLCANKITKTLFPHSLSVRI